MNFKNIFETELEKGNIYNLFLSLNLSKIDEQVLKCETEKERDFYNKLYDLALQTKQVELIEKGIF